VAAELRDVRAAGRLHVLAARDRAVDDVVERDDQRVAALLQAIVLFRQSFEDCSCGRFALLDQRERQVFLGMVQHVG
jgi:hypothetical protein